MVATEAGNVDTDHICECTCVLLLRSSSDLAQSSPGSAVLSAVSLQSVSFFLSSLEVYEAV